MTTILSDEFFARQMATAILAAVAERDKPGTLRACKMYASPAIWSLAFAEAGIVLGAMTRRYMGGPSSLSYIEGRELSHPSLGPIGLFT